MGITREEFQQFEKRMDERHTRIEELHAQVMGAIECLPCAAHQLAIDKSNAFMLRVKTIAGVALKYVLPGSLAVVAFLLKYGHLFKGGTP